MKDIVERAAIALYSHQAWAMNGYPVWQSLNADVKARLPGVGARCAGCRQGRHRRDG